MKKFIAIILTIAMMFTLVACVGKKDKDDAAAIEDVASETEIVEEVATESDAEEAEEEAEVEEAEAEEADVEANAEV